MIELQNITKSFRVSRRGSGWKAAVKSLFHREYETVQALKNISFSIQDGEMVGYIGPNGAGKSSTIKVMSGILTPDSGKCLIDGKVPWLERKSHVRNIGVVFGQRSQLWWDVPVIDSFELIRDIYEISPALYRNNLEQLTSMLNLETILKTPVRQLSLGQRMRCEIAASLLHSPKVLFLDEPTIGLDAVSKIAVRDFIRTINREQNTTVILTTHDMQDIEALTERIILIGHGKILQDGSLAQLMAENDSAKTLTVSFRGVFPATELEEGFTCKELLSERATLVLDTTKLSVSSAIAWLSSHIDITDVNVTGTNIEEMVVKLYEKYRV